MYKEIEDKLDKALTETTDEEIRERLKRDANYIHVDFDSCFWTSLEMLIHCIKIDPRCDKEYLIKGLENTLKEGYDLRR